MLVLDSSEMLRSFFCLGGGCIGGGSGQGSAWSSSVVLGLGGMWGEGGSGVQWGGLVKGVVMMVMVVAIGEGTGQAAKANLGDKRWSSASSQSVCLSGDCGGGGGDAGGGGDRGVSTPHSHTRGDGGISEGWATVELTGTK